MNITDLETTDSESYYCCLPSNCSPQIDEDRCQKFVLTVNGKPGSLLVETGFVVTVFEQKAVCLDFINENKNDINKKKANSTQRRPLKFLNATKQHGFDEQFLMPRTLEITFPSF